MDSSSEHLWTLNSVLYTGDSQHGLLMGCCAAVESDAKMQHSVENSWSLWSCCFASATGSTKLPHLCILLYIHEAKKIKHTHNIIIIYDFVANLFWLFAANSRPNSQPGSWLFGDCLVSFSYLTLSDCERFHSHNNFNANSICFANTLPSVFWPLRLLSSCFQPVNNVFPHNLHGRQRSKDWNRCHMQWRKCVSQMRAIEGGVTAPQKQKVFHFVCPM
jgi:hypothetical protein